MSTSSDLGLGYSVPLSSKNNPLAIFWLLDYAATSQDILPRKTIVQDLVRGRDLRELYKSASKFFKKNRGCY